MQYYGALDQSTTSTRFTLFSKEGNVAFVSQKFHSQITTHQGWLEHDPMELLDNVKKCMDEVGKYDLLSLGVTNQRETIVGWNRINGKPYLNAIVWSDTRTAGICNEFLNKYPKEYFQEQTGLPINTYFSAYKIKWMMENCEELKNDIENVLFGTIDCWIIWNLTGNHYTDVTNASRTNLMDLKTLQWDQQLLELFNIPQKSLPKIKASGSNYGQIKEGIYKGQEINAVLGDQQAAAIGHALFNKGDCKNTQGSGLFLMTNIGNEPKISKKGVLTTVLYQIEGQNPIYGFEGAIESGGQLLNWAKDKQHWFNTWEELTLSISKTENNGGVYLVPAFSGLFTPYWNQNATGTLLGLTYFTNQDHIRRAIMESICYRTRDVIEAMESSGIIINNINVDGGLTQNKVLMQLQADITQKTLNCPTILESTSLGVALFSALSKQLIGLNDIVQMIQIHHQFQPKNSYNQQYQQWINAVDCALRFTRM